MTDSSKNFRPAARVVVMSPRDRVLLVRFELATGGFWATPGGGVEGDETREAAARRELREETGIDDVELVGPIWDRTHHFPLHGFDGQNEQYFLARTTDEVVNPQFTEQELLDEGVTALRWWALDEILSSEEIFAPRDLGARLTDLRMDGPPKAPILLADQHPDF